VDKIKELKAEVYDILIQIEHLQRLLQQKNAEIVQESQKVKKAPEVS